MPERTNKSVGGTETAATVSQKLLLWTFERQFVLTDTVRTHILLPSARKVKLVNPQTRISGNLWTPECLSAVRPAVVWLWYTPPPLLPVCNQRMSFTVLLNCFYAAPQISHESSEISFRFFSTRLSHWSWSHLALDRGVWWSRWRICARSTTWQYAAPLVTSFSSSMVVMAWTPLPWRERMSRWSSRESSITSGWVGLVVDILSSCYFLFYCADVEFFFFSFVGLWLLVTGKIFLTLAIVRLSFRAVRSLLQAEKSHGNTQDKVCSM